MALTHETLHIYKSFHFYKRDPTDALLLRTCPREDVVSPGYLSRGDVLFFSPRVVGDRLCRPRARKRRGAFIYLFFSFLFSFSPPLRVLQHYETVVGCVLLSCLVTRDSCVLRSPAGLKPDKDYHTPDVLCCSTCRPREWRLSFRGVRRDVINMRKKRWKKRRKNAAQDA